MSQGRTDGRRVSSIPVGYDREGRRIRVRRRRKSHPGEVVLYPIVDGPGVAALVMMPPFLAVMTLPVIDLFATFNEKNALNPILLLMIPFTLPMVFCFAMVMGYFLLFIGRILAAGAMGEDDHPRWPHWDTGEIAAGLARWIWAGATGLFVGGAPAVWFWLECGEVDLVDGFIFIDLVILGATYALMGIASALLHENLIACNPVTIIQSIVRVGWDYVSPCTTAVFGIATSSLAWGYVLFHAPNAFVGVLGMWVCWIWTLYQLMVIFRALGLTYYRHAERLDWFRKPPPWGM
ncbi:MAG: hypothetical protein SFX72_20125 [Isosphaeraceae bacterium]|nr:hypothetical protein [Isosphaeraceae bacterium]